MKPWTKRRLYAALKRAIHRKDISLRVRPLKTAAAFVTINKGKPHRIAIDSTQTGVIPGVIHELLHVLLAVDLLVFGADVEEDIIILLENQMTERALSTTEETEWWRAAIDRKLKAA